MNARKDDGKAHTGRENIIRPNTFMVTSLAPNATASRRLARPISKMFLGEALGLYPLRVETERVGHGHQFSVWEYFGK